MKRSTVRLLLLLVLLVFVVPIAAFAAEDNETPTKGNNSTPAAVETTPASAPAPASGTGSTEGSTPAQQPATPTGTTPATPTGTTPGETPAAPTGTTPGETPATPTGTTPGETPATTDGTTPEDKPDAAEEDEENPEPAAEKADVEKAKLAGVKKNGAMLGALQEDSDQSVTTRKNLNRNEKMIGDFTIKGDGVVLGPQDGTATIEDANVTNHANNEVRGQIDKNECNGSAFVARCKNSLTFNGVTITSDPKTLPLNIWANSSITANGLTLNGPNNDSVDTVFMLVGNYVGSGKGTLNFTGNNEFSGVTGTIAGAKIASDISDININSGTLTVTNSTIKMANNIALTVKNGATLKLMGDSQITGNITVESGGTLALDGARSDSSVATFEDGAKLELQNGASFEVKAGETLNLGGVEVTRGANTLKGTGTLDMVNGREINIFNGANLTAEYLTIKNAIINDDTFTNKNVTFINDTINVSSGHTTTLDNCRMVNSAVVVNNGGTLVTKNQTSFTTDSKEAGAGAINDKNYIYVKSGGTLEMTDSTVEKKAGSFVAIRANNATVNLNDCIFENNSHPNDYGGVIRAEYGGTMTVTNCTFQDNTARWGGAISVNAAGKGAGTLTINGTSKFSNNIASGQASSGGAIYMNGGTLTIDGGSTFTGNLATGYQFGDNLATAGGAIMLTGVINAIILERRTIQFNLTTRVNENGPTPHCKMI